jgi:signal peptidase I
MTAESAQKIGWGRGLGSLFLGTLLLLAAFGLLFGFRAFLYQSFNIPSGAMKPTLLVGDYIVVSKYAYGYSRYSLPGSPPLFAGRIFAAQPRYGDVVVFRLPHDPSTEYVKRLVGLPGDRIQMIHGLLHINAAPVGRERIEDFIDKDDTSGGGNRGKQWRETLPNGASYVTLDLVDEGFYDNTVIYTVPAGHYFMIGDNRDNSTDSRTPQVGYVPFENLVGRVERIVFSVDRDSRAFAMRSERIGMGVH